MTFDREQTEQQMAQAIHRHMQAVRDRGDYIVGPASDEAATDALPIAVRAVTDPIRVLHAGIDALNTRYNRVQKVCVACGTDDGNWQIHPCPTARLLDEIDAQAGGEQ